mmetsp:Transcript_89422/g.251834  ORF Transcript_89422/g.251834 Transcript_89422/m.251834 type:complete len:200 (+) Transcript_89422:1199-1798(+)
MSPRTRSASWQSFPPARLPLQASGGGASGSATASGKGCRGQNIVERKWRCIMASQRLRRDLSLLPRVLPATEASRPVRASGTVARRHESSLPRGPQRGLCGHSFTRGGARRTTMLTRPLRAACQTMCSTTFFAECCTSPCGSLGGPRFSHSFLCTAFRALSRASTCCAVVEVVMSYAPSWIPLASSRGSSCRGLPLMYR